MFMPGMEIPVLIDPKNEQNLVIDYKSANRQTTGTGTAVVSPSAPQHVSPSEAELVQWQKDNDAIMNSGRPARAIIKKYTWLGAYVNGNNPYVELELEVLPENAAAFPGKARGVIGEAAVSKYQPGCEIFVKYDLYDNSKVAVDHS